MALTHSKENVAYCIIASCMCELTLRVHKVPVIMNMYFCAIISYSEDTVIILFRHQKHACTCSNLQLAWVFRQYCKFDIFRFEEFISLEAVNILTFMKVHAELMH